MLDGILSPAAVQLHEELRRGRPIVTDPAELKAKEHESPAQELYRRGLVMQPLDDPRRLVAMEPREAISTSIGDLLDQVLEPVATDLHEINFFSGSPAATARIERKFFNTARMVRADRGGWTIVPEPPEWYLASKRLPQLLTASRHVPNEGGIQGSREGADRGGI